MNPVLEVQNLSKSYRASHRGGDTFREEIGIRIRRLFARRQHSPLSNIMALQDVSFALEQGDILGVVGRNGAGKSTLLKILAGIVAPSDGQVAYKGKLVSILEFGAGFHPELTGRENIFLNGELLGLGRQGILRRLEEIVEFSELAGSIDEPVKHYSNGMYLRLAFSIFAHLETDILLLDEITSVGDIGFRQKSYAKILDLANQGTTILLVSHDPDQVKDLCNKCLFLEKGRLVTLGATSEVINSYLESYLIAETTVVKGAIVSGHDVRWPAGLNICGELLVTRFSVNAGNKTAAEAACTKDDLELTLEFEKLNDEGTLEITFTILSLYGTWVLADSYGLYEKFDGLVKERGRYRCLCTIPGGVINFGVYQLGYLVSKSEVLIYQNPCLMNYRIRLKDEEGVKNHLAKVAASLVKPLGRWQIFNNRFPVEESPSAADESHPGR
jgi:ABC-type polysaccharide/polyol phosphate transport system ATPase subunit